MSFLEAQQILEHIHTYIDVRKDRMTYDLVNALRQAFQQIEQDHVRLQTQMDALSTEIGRLPKK